MTRIVRRLSVPSFTSNTRAFLEEARRQDAAAVPDATHHKRRHHYREIVRPQDLCDLFAKLSFTDVFVGTFAGEFFPAGVSKSPVTSTKLHFAAVASDWVAQFNDCVFRLKELPSSKMTHSVNMPYTADDVASYGAILAFVKSGSAAAFLVQTPEVQADPKKYANVLKCVENHLQDFNLRTLMPGLLPNTTPEQLHIFNEFFKFDAVPYDPTTLDRLAYVMALAGNVLVALALLVRLVQSHRIAPSRATLGLFMLKYAAKAPPREEALKELMPLKPAIFHRVPDNFGFFLTLVNTRDELFHLLKLADADTLKAHKSDILDKLRGDRVGLAQLARWQSVVADDVMRS